MPLLLYLIVNVLRRPLGGNGIEYNPDQKSGKGGGIVFLQKNSFRGGVSKIPPILTFEPFRSPATSQKGVKKKFSRNFSGNRGDSSGIYFRSCYNHG